MLIAGADDISVENRNFEILPWPVNGWRSLDPGTGDEAGTTEGPFEVTWRGDYYYAENLAVATENNKCVSSGNEVVAMTGLRVACGMWHVMDGRYLDGLGAMPEAAVHGDGDGDGDGDCASGENAIYLWMSDYHPDGGQLFWPMDAPIPFVVSGARADSRCSALFAMHTCL